MPFSRHTGRTVFSKLRYWASRRLSGICTLSHGCIPIIRRCVSGARWPEKPKKRTLPAFFASSAAFMPPRSGSNTRSGSSAYWIAWNCRRSIRSVRSRRRLSSSCRLTPS